MSRLERILFEVRRGWFPSLVIALLVIFVIGWEIWRGSQIAVPGESRVATITAFSNLDTTADPGKIGVYAVSGEGLQGYARVTLNRVTGCKVGDPIRAELVETRLRLDPWPCTGERP